MLDVQKKKKKRKNLKQNKITFDDEVVTKEDLQGIVSNTENKVEIQKNNINTAVKDDSETLLIPLKKKKKKQSKEEDVDLKINKNKTIEEVTEEDDKEKIEEEEINEKNPQNILKSNEPSKRSLKKQKYVKLLQEKHLKSELANQERCLNYLSLWKHNRDEWKFEKLRQVWLQQNMFDENKVPDNFFDILIEYFSNAKGKVKNLIVDGAVKFVEDEQLQNDSHEDNKKKIERARTIIQFLNT